MSREQFTTQRFSAASLAMVARCNEILTEYNAQGYRLSLRQLYYQLVSRDVIPNNLRSYKNLGDLVSNARLAGLIDWFMIEDRGRDYVLPSHWGEPGEIIESAAASYRIDKWSDQPWRVEVMVEKDALSGVLGPVCRAEDIGFTANRGYSSSSAMYEAGKRLASHLKRHQRVLMLYLGDHDPSGIDMTRDVGERLALFARAEVQVKRLALNMDQVEQYNPPENPAKTTDSRAESYIALYGDSSWELDALEPNVLAALITNAVNSVRDPLRWRQAQAREAEARETLQKMADNYAELADYAANL